MPTYNKKTSEKYKQGKERPVHKKKRRPFSKGAKSKGSVTCLEKNQEFFRTFLKPAILLINNLCR